MKRIAIFGATGSIGSQMLEILTEHPSEFQVTALTAHRQADRLENLRNTWNLSEREVHLGPIAQEKLQELLENTDFVVNALPGFVGVTLSIEALKRGKTLLSANKESLAVAGRFLKDLAKTNGGEIRPLDSEASALWQLQNTYADKPIKNVTLTCSGGPFRGKRREHLREVSVKEALKHPTWSMGPKVSIDSASLVNKVLEVYEVHHLFDIPLTDIHIVIHPQSLVHAMIHTQTGATRMHLSPHDMKVFLRYALFYPDKSPEDVEMGTLSHHDLQFDGTDPETFRPLAWLSYHRGNPNFPLVLNALNDLAVEWFLQGKMGFLELFEFIESELPKWLWKTPPRTLEDILAYHQDITTSYESRFAARSGSIHTSLLR